MAKTTRSQPDEAASTPDGDVQDASTADASAAPKPKKRATRTKKADEAPKRSRAKTKPEPDAEAAPAKKPAKKAAKPRIPVIDLSSKAPVVDLTSSNGSATSSANGSADGGDAPAEAPRKRRRTRKPADAGPVASSDNLPDEGDDASHSEPQNRRDDGEQGEGGGGRRKRKRNRNKNKGGDQQQGGGKSDHPGEPFDGMLELIGDKKFGFIRGFDTSLQKGDNDPFCPPPLIQKYNLRDGVRLSGTIKPGRKGAWQVDSITEVMGVDPEEWADTPDFDKGAVIYPEDKLELVSGPADVSMRVVDLVTPLGKGQRALIVAPPRAGKTVLLKGIAAGLAKNHPGIELVALLIDERPEEVTDFRRNTEATVFASSNDYGEDNHVRVATLAFEYSRRLVEQGKDVVVLLDSLTRLGRTFNLFGGNSGRTMSGGLDARALVMPRKIFSSARNIEGGGSLTIIATALVETGSRMDDVIFEEFKGTGNAEIVLDRELSEKRIYPAINIRKSGTRNEERLVPEEHVAQRHLLLRALNSRHPVEAMQALLKQIQMSPTNVHLLNELIPEQSY